jgi:uncharacterized glyoxalase superfamily protein PhnB
VQRITCNLIVESIEDCLPFWIERLGFQKVAEVPHEDRLGFVILVHGEAQLMLQTRASVKADVPEAAEGPYRASLYVHVEDLEPIRAGLGDWPRVIPERTTFYGSREIIVRDPAGNVVAFAAREAT